MRKLIVLEVNEVPFKVYDHFIDHFPNSLLAKVLTQSTQYITKTSDEGELHPWSTWATFYRGVDNTLHGIKDIGEDLIERDENYPPVWKSLVDQGISTGIFSSLHTHPLPSNVDKYDFLVPDPFANGDDVHPERVRPFQAFNLAMTKRSGRSVDRRIDKKSAFRLILALPRLGLRFRTLWKTLSQLISEKSKPWLTSRRRAFQSILAFDIYMNLLKNHKPQFTTLFSNHVASAMHRYWAATFPEDYVQNDLPKEWIDRYKGEIDWCMWQLEGMLETLVEFISKNPEYKLILASSMGQAATEARLTTQELFLNEFDQLNEALGKRVMPLTAMHPQYNFRVELDEEDEIEQKLRSIRLNDEPLRFRRKEGGFFSLDLGYPNVKSFEIKMGERTMTLEEMGFEIREIDDQSGGTAYHIPYGSLFVYDIQNPTIPNRKEVDLREIAPSILKAFNIDRLDYMKQGVIEEIFR